MSKTNLIVVKDKKTKKLFYDTARKIYADDNNWVCPLDTEIESIFDPNQNQSFKKGDAIRWVAVDDNYKPVGRIAAFYQKDKAFKYKPYAGGTGFFESINDQNIASALFDKAKEWLKTKGMEAMDGPITFGENFVYWGLLIDGFTQQGYGMQYHKPYYKDLFENYGFKNYYEQYTYHVDLTKPFNQRHVKFAEYIAGKENYTFDHFRMKDKDKFIDEILEIFNTVWSDFHKDYTPLKREDIEQIINNSKDVIKEEFIWFVYDKGTPIGMFITFPDVNQIIKPFNGKLNLVNKIRFMVRKNNKNVLTRARQPISGLTPDYQRKGLAAPLFVKMVEKLKKHDIKELEISWVGEYNEPVNRIYKHMGNAWKTKTHATYRYLFDRNAKFERFKNE